ncbi:MAG: tetratricopeptide repeat protein [bacterium]|nr:tetratricopeptide repeat protein [bacterium]
MRAVKYSPPVRNPFRNQDSFTTETSARQEVRNELGKKSSPSYQNLQNSRNWFEKISRGCLYLFIFLVPIFFLPFTPDFIEFNKQYLLYGLVGIALLSWVIRGFLERGFKISRTHFDLPLLGLLGIVFISSLVSKDRTASFFGEYDRLTFGAIPFLWYTIFFYLLVHHIRTAEQIRRVFFLLASGATISALYFWAAIAGISKIPALEALVPAWNTVSAGNSRFIVLLIVPLLIAFTFLLEMKISRAKKVFWSAVAGIAFLSIAALGFKGVFLIGAVGLAVWLAVVFTRLVGMRLPVVSLAMAVFLMFVLGALFGTGGFLRVASFPIEVSLSQGASWNIALDTLKEGVGRALIGSGPATFGYDFSAHRPEEFNKNIFWSLRFPTASSEAAALTATLGALGMVFLIFLLAVVFWMFKTMSVRTQGETVETRSLFGATMGIWGGLFIMLFFIPFGTVGWVYFFTILALFAAQGRLYMKEEAKEMLISIERSPSASLLSSFGGIVLLAILLVLTIYLGRFYAGEVYFLQGARASTQQQGEKAIASFARAATINPKQLRYVLALTQVQFQSAVQESQKQTPDIARAGRLISGAVSSARRATELAPGSAAAWEQLGGLYGQVVGLAPEAREWAIAAYGQALELEPTNPALFVLRGQQFLADKKLTEAQNDFERAIELKSDYPLAHIALSSLFEGQKDFDKAVAAAEQAARFAGNDLNIAYQLARLYFNRNEGEDSVRAERILLAIIARNSDYSNAHFTLGSLYERQGKSNEALKEFEKVRELNPQNEEIRKKVEGLTAPEIGN